MVGNVDSAGNCVLVLRGTDFSLPSYRGLAHNLTRDAAIKMETEIRQQTVEGEKLTLCYIVGRSEAHPDCDPEECPDCDDVRLFVAKQELEVAEKAMAEGGEEILRRHKDE